MIVFLPLFVALVGLLVYVLNENPKLQTLGLWAYGCGLLAFLLVGGEQVVTIFSR